jgi:GNAT superfamily N-acetyltransferase
MDLQIRKAKKSDISSFLDLYAQLDIDAGQILDLCSAEKLFDKIQTYPNYNVYIAVLNDKVVGTLELLIMDNMAHLGTPSGIVEDVVVQSDFRGQGIGKKMMQFALDECRKAGCYKMTLSSNLRRDRAHHFYESLGFKKHGYSFQISFEK